ncbi:hypothetical protein JK182_01805 [Acetobacter okinawensis]|uniref:hypothetical protein n=1 Tax=Acetobacter okinawensis TaxID=1076594 RepID=UPI001BAC9118|nr:hypothetical protein [Acetobacter okinawensis]MBS0987428.1 hypothetical protein [Acetobacter okinawensis]
MKNTSNTTTNGTNTPPLYGRELQDCLLQLRWSVRLLADMIDEPSSRIDRVVKSRNPNFALTPSVSKWVRGLAQHHLENPPPPEIAARKRQKLNARLAAVYPADFSRTST